MRAIPAALPPEPPPNDRPARRRPWYRWHWGTYLVAAVLAGALLYANLQKVEPVADLRLATVTALRHRFALEAWTYGWPILYSEGWQQVVTPLAVPRRPRIGPHDSRFYATALPINAAAALLILASSVWLSERFCRGRRTALQFNLRHLFLLATVIAVVLSIWRAWPQEQIVQFCETAFGQEQLTSRMFSFPPYVYVPLLAGLTCVLWVAFRGIDLLLSRYVLRLLRFLGSSLPKSPSPAD